jgi:glycosyltransferase involved in cell wall biosynthesis
VNRKIKILFFVEQNIPSRFYEAYFKEFFGNENFEFYLINLAFCPALELQLQPYFKKMFSPASFVPYRKQVNAIKAVLKEVKPDIIHAHETIPAFYANLANILTGQKARIIYHRHHSFYNSYKMRIMDQMAAVFSKKIICVSEFSKQQAAKEHPLLKHKLIRVYNGVTLGDTLLSDNEKALFNEMAANKRVKMLFLARLKPRKGHILAIEVMQEVVKKFPAVTLYITGSGELADEISRAIEDKNLSDNVLLTGPVEGVKELLKSVEMVILPSESEAFSLTVLETLSQGKLLLASDLPSIKEIITHGTNGILIDPFNKMEWVNEICFYLANKNERESIGLNGKKLFESGFTMKKMADQMQEIFNKQYK